jgi:hypothetical protein
MATTGIVHALRDTHHTQTLAVQQHSCLSPSTVSNTSMFASPQPQSSPQASTSMNMEAASPSTQVM